ALRAQLTSLQLRLEARVQDADADEAGNVELRRAIVETRAKIDAHRVREDAVSAGDSKLTESLQELQRLLPANTAVLAYFVGDTTTYAWLLRRSDLRLVKLGGRAELAGITDEFVEQKRFTHSSATHSPDPGAQLFGRLLDGVSE